MTTWRQQFLVEIIDFCNARGSRGFILQEFTDERLGFLQAFRPSKKSGASPIWERRFSCL